MNRSIHETEIVPTLGRAVAERVGVQRFRLWFSGTHWRYDHGMLEILGRDSFRLKWLESKMRGEIAAVCQSVVGADVEVRFQLVDGTPHDVGNMGISVTDYAAIMEDASGPASVEESSRRMIAAPRQESAIADTLNRRKYARIEEVISGACNQVALASMRMIIDEPGRINPLYLYGPPGCGKTLLLEGLYSALRAKATHRRCVYLTAEQFTNYFQTSLHGQGMPSFRQRYRHVDLLVIEDLQYFANKTATIAELQHTMDAVMRDGGQLAFSADRSPADLRHLGQDLANRLCGGIVARLEPLDRATRRDLLRQLASQRCVAIPDDVVDLLADKTPGDARYISGALLRLQAFAAAWTKPITADLAASALEDLFQVANRVVRLDDIERVVCEVFGIEPQKLQSSNRTQRVSQPRMLAMWLARKHTGSALSEIGHHFGKRSHSSVVMAERKVNSLMESNAQVRIADGTMAMPEVLRRIEQRLMVG